MPLNILHRFLPLKSAKTQNKTMKIALGLQTKTEPQRIILGKQIATDMLANSTIYGACVPDAAAINLAAMNAEADTIDKETKDQAAASATTKKEGSFNILDDAIAKAASWTEDNVLVAADIEKVFTLQKERTTTTSIRQVLALAATIGDKAGETDLAWDAVLKASSYEIQLRLAGTTDWIHAKVTSSSSTTIKGLISGSLYQFRVRAHGPHELEGEWSDIAEKRAA